jgi:hypothetical protein
MPRLTDTQLVTLSAASHRDDRAVDFLDHAGELQYRPRSRSCDQRAVLMLP